MEINDKPINKSVVSPGGREQAFSFMILLLFQIYEF